jgi:hypothetical protein
LVLFLDLLAKLFVRTPAAPPIVRTRATPAPEPELEPPEPVAEATDVEPDVGYWWKPDATPTPPGPAPQDPLDPREGQVSAILQRLLEGGDLDLPILPLVAHRALNKLRSEDVDYRELAKLIGEDPAIAAPVRRVV